MVDPADVVQKIEAGRAVFVRDLRTLAHELEQPPVRDAGEVLAWLAPHFDRLRHETVRILGRDRTRPRQ
jgi:hypothetical protein